MNKKQIITSLINNANNLDNSGFYKEANILTKLAYDILPEDIIMPGDRPRLNTDSTLNDIPSDTTANQIDVIKTKLDELKELVENLPEYTLTEEEYDEDVRSFPMHKKYILEYLNMAIDEIPQMERYI
jgi:hypothetical protein